MGGSFDPVHYGHLRAAQWAIQAFALDSVRLMPARQSPFKGPSLASGEDRLRMLTLAIKDNPALAVEECELLREGPSYTVETLRALAGREPSSLFTLIVGSDAALALDKWRDFEEIHRLAQVRVLTRPGDAATAPLVDAVPFEGLAISSTAIRHAVKSGQSIRYLTPESVRFYIEEKGLYK